ncbi:hypothetical protein CcaverHIS002_0510280 [Cutaneotrichosporon cavernicola]|uniref:Amidase n=1 Tax=Cutaneotrichosporon cavernicola TaxID=279322 RepID=A0AA48L7E6_9TREE|nr:uncharacterized protein CcaverHIS019_0510840 [Cutaneotrichosporon cavernicola]BEI85627.1 hypothetical protein CcaverHIS002_0510280 [Cutaneotrichosporon cavernicola]BEI93456.1 hypothetical protein CcaverHIS019_0510840 [Cutaneotrichosporon cavernicola]BEJ01234.1 hypothetical protein CcaverHIS631_0510910 [Cutaneotrichosporon cavernicola]BEJ09003.1 hypothetical protein CcaverHIS641_0510970 [Cutaneotrichosporon cavernicola]
MTITTPKTDSQRMNATLQSSCQWGSTPDGGMNRLALNDDDARVRRWFISETKALGCSVSIDAMGNIFAVRPGRRNLPPIAVGSHLDTQPTGGRYDGILGVLAGLEILKALQAAQYETDYPVAAVCWTNEEGARFVPSCLGSGVYAGDMSLEYGHTRTDTAGVSVRSELERHDMLGSMPASHTSNPLSAHFELHIEQGPILFEAGLPVAAVSGVQGWRWFEISLQGRGSHAGTTPFGYRRDPLIAFAKLVLAAEEIAKSHRGLCTIGRVGSAAIQSTNCVMDDVVFHLDIRHRQLEGMDALERAMRKEFARIVGGEEGVEIARWDTLSTVDPTVFDADAVNCVREAARLTGTAHDDLVSGAGHDSVFTARNCPTAMCFIRCRDGISHHPSEYSTPEDIAIGTETLLQAVLAYESKMAAKLA